jgi:preprotein translocase subunit SecA
MGILDKIFGNPNDKIIKNLQPIIEDINNREETLKALKDDELKQKTFDLKENLTQSKLDEKTFIDQLLPEAFALVREASRRVLGMRHYDVQLIGGIILHRGQIAEMKTGEGKTLVATLPLYLNALSGKGAQLITVNDYLSRVGAGWMAPVYHLLGLTTGVITHDSAHVYDPEFTDESQYDARLQHFRPIARKEAYQCDILYGTNNEFGFDYLRDNMAPSMERKVQRGLNYCIVDEIDSILIDEARTPLIISAPAEESTDKYFKFAQLVSKLNENEDYNIDEKMRTATLSESGVSRMEKWLGVDNIYTAGGIREVHHIEQALKAHALFKLDRDYVVKDGEVIIVDEFTGRLMHGRRYSEGLHQAIEAKEGVKIQRESQTLATITFQNYFRLYKKLAGMTGTAATEAEEFSKIYNLDTVIIPTNRVNQRKDLNDLIYKTEMGKFQAVIKEVKERSLKGQPILVGTISIEKNELLASMMEREGLRPQVLNAKNHEKEAKFIAQAGAKGSVTIATNMAGRGVDIILGGENASQEVQEEVRNLGGLHVIGTERHESRRIDNQLRGRAARQGDPGSSQFFVSTEDDLMRIFGGDRMKNLMTTLRVPEDMPIENKLISRSIESAQMKVEGNNFDIRKHLVEYDDVINKHREAIYKKRNEVLKRLAVDAVDENGESMIGSEKMIFNMIESELEQVVNFHTSAERINDWDINEIYQVVRTIFPVSEDLKTDLIEHTKDNHKLDKIKARTKIIEYIIEKAKEKYQSMKENAAAKGVDWQQLENSIILRSIDMLWIEHLEAMASVRQGIGLRGYGQRDPLIEYKKEAYRLFNELNNFIQKEVVYGIFKVGSIEQASEAQFKEPSIADMAVNFSAPQKVMEKKTSGFAGMMNQASLGGEADMIKKKSKDEEGNKIGRNDLCPCGSGKKYKKCHGK